MQYFKMDYKELLISIDCIRFEYDNSGNLVMNKIKDIKGFDEVFSKIKDMKQEEVKSYLEFLRRLTLTKNLLKYKKIKKSDLTKLFPNHKGKIDEKIVKIFINNQEVLLFDNFFPELKKMISDNNKDVNDILNDYLIKIKMEG